MTTPAVVHKNEFVNGHYKSASSNIPDDVMLDEEKGEEFELPFRSWKPAWAFLARVTLIFQYYRLTVALIQPAGLIIITGSILLQRMKIGLLDVLWSPY